MLKETLIEFFERDLLKLKEEVSLYRKEEDLWLVKGEISNSAGNLCLHLIGNLKHFIGAVLGNSGYIRERESEFTFNNIPRAQLLNEIENTKTIVIDTLNKMNNDEFEKLFPVEKHGKQVTTENMLIHLFGHFNYHLGQINYHRRLVMLFPS